jgi:hypothetical protein
MKPEDQILFACIRQEFGKPQIECIERISREHSVSWDQSFEIAERHNVAPIVYANLIQCPAAAVHIPEEVQRKYRMYAARNLLRKDARLRRLSQALEFFNKKSIDVLLIKGIALDLMVYENPWFTDSNDIDIVVHKKHEDFSKEEMLEIQHFMYNSGIEYDFYEHHDVTMNGILKVDFDEIWRDATEINIDSCKALIMSVEDLLIVTCINSCRKRYFRLKSLLDLNEILSNYPKLDWEKVARKAKSYDCSNILLTALLVANQTVRCSVPQNLHTLLGVSPFRNWLVRKLVILTVNRLCLYSWNEPGRIILGKPLNYSLVLPYLSYRPYQITRKLIQNYRILFNHP